MKKLSSLRRYLASIDDLIKNSNLTEAQLKAVIEQVKKPFHQDKVIKHDWGKSHVKIALIGDTHVGSKFSDYAMLSDLFKRFKAEGVDAVYHTGDLTEGYNMRLGHSLEVDLHGVDEQVDGVIKNFPDIGKPIYFILGNHDLSHYKSSGTDIGKIIEAKRKDMHYLGAEHADIQLGDVKLTLLHPGSGSAYAVSYKPQKIAEALSGGEKPNILAIGHFHKIEYLFYRNIHIFQTGTTQRQTDFQKRMNLSAHMGAWVVDIYYKKDGTIDKLQQTLFPYY